MSFTFTQYLSQIEFWDHRENLVHHSYQNQDILSLKEFDRAQKEISSWPRYRPTPLRNLADLAQQTGVGQMYYKDECDRFSLKSFKALGGAYAVANLLIHELKKQGCRASSKDLFQDTYRHLTKRVTVCCATDGNHGRSVAWGASIFGCGCEIFIHHRVSQEREEAIKKYGAKVTRIQGNYDDSVRIAAETAQENGYFIVSDTSYEGYTEIPKDVMQGYTIMVDEALKQIAKKPTHIFLQGGVGGMAAAVASFVLETYPKNPPEMIVVEPLQADCLLQSAKNQQPTIVHGDLNTIMAGLACGEVSLLAWKILENRISAFISIPDEPIKETMNLLAGLDTPVVAGESAVAGLAGYLIVQGQKEYREKLRLDQNSIVLFFGTEGDTDEAMYQRIVGKTSKEVLGTSLN